MEPNPEPTDPVRDFFNRLAGEDGEVDWQELKEILDYAMREGVYETICYPIYTYIKTHTYIHATCYQHKR